MRVPEPDALPLQRTRTGLTVVITTSGFREGPGPDAAAAAIAEGVHAASPATRVLPIPVMDGGSFAEEVTRLWSGVIETITVLDEDGRPMLARMGLAGPAGERIAVIGVDDARDLRRASPDRRDPSRASSRGVGQLIRAALDRGARRMVIGCGDSGPNDGGVGMATELGIRFLDANRMEIVEAGGLQRLARVDMTRRDPRLDGISLEVVINPGNALLGDSGTARRFAARSGAAPGQVRRLEIGLARYADVIRDLSGMDVTRLPGAGAGGGLAAGLAAFVGARLTPRLDFLRQGLRVDRHLAMADMAITAADGAADSDNVSEVPAWLAWRARTLGLPVVALAPPACDDGAGGADRRGTTGSARSVRSEDTWQRTREWLRSASSRAMRAAVDRVTPTTPLPSSRPGAT
jgi:glycerate kinase